MPTKIEWMRLDGFSIDDALNSEGFSFEAFETIARAAGDAAASKVKGKIISYLAKELRSTGRDHLNVDINDIKHGVYCIGISGGFEMNYTKQSSKILYIGSGNIYSRVRGHLRGKLFEVFSELRNIPLSVSFCDLTNASDGKRLQLKLEQELLSKFRDTIDQDLPLLNSKDAISGPINSDFAKGWDKPLHKARGPKSINWLLTAADAQRWKGSLK